MEEKQNYIPKFKLKQKVKYIGSNGLFEFDKRNGKKKNEYTIDEIINYNEVRGYFPQSVPLKYSGREDKGECRYLIGGRWSVTESDLEAL